MADEPNTPLEGEEIDGEFDKTRALAKIHKTNSENAALRKRLADFEKAEKDREDADKDELTKAQEASVGLSASVGSLTLENTRLRVALSRGLTEKQAARLQGASREDLEADADDFLADLAPRSADTESLTARPRENLPRGGGDPEIDVVETDPDKLAALIPRS